VWRVAQGSTRPIRSRARLIRGPVAAPWLAGAFRFGVPRDEDLEFFGDDESRGCTDGRRPTGGSWAARA
jgi:hypothetical protein